MRTYDARLANHRPHFPDDNGMKWARSPARGFSCSHLIFVATGIGLFLALMRKLDVYLDVSSRHDR